MNHFSKRSKKNLSSCHEDIRIVLNEVIKEYDFSVLHGHRTIDEQMELFKQGREFKDGVWVVDPKKVVTYKDGTINKSKHNEYPSVAVDIAPYPIDWEDENRFLILSDEILRTAMFLFNDGKISHRMIWGGNWKMKDLLHFELANV